MKIAILDMGTNTFNLLVRQMPKGDILSSTKIAVKLGEGGLQAKRITPEAQSRGVEAIHTHLKTAREFEVSGLYAFATSAVRDAENQEEFLQLIQSQTGISVNVLSGDQEASLIYQGVRQAVDMDGKTHLIVDIGGGSTECIICDGQEVFWQHSFDLGSSRLQEHFKPHDPLRDEEIEAINQHLDQLLQPLYRALADHPAEKLVGSSGSFDTLAAMILARFDQPNPLLDGHTSYTFDLHEYRWMGKHMLVSDYEQRLHTPGMIPMRADLMPMAVLIIHHLLRHSSIQKMMLSTFALKEGVTKTLLDNPNAWQKSSL